MIDVIIPAYNANKYISNALDSLESQTIKDDLIITIIDDGSIEGYERIIAKYKKILKINLLILKRNHGVGYARNFGMKNTNSKYIFFLDADDVLVKENSLELLLKTMENNNYKIVIAKEYLNKNISFYDNHLLAKLMKREVIKKYKLKVPNYLIAEDTAFIFSYYAVIDNNEKYYLDEYIYKHRNVNASSLTKIYLNDNYSYNQYFIAIDYAYKYVKKNNKYDFFKKRLPDIFLNISEIYINKVNKDIIIPDKFLKNAKKFYNKYYKFIGDLSKSMGKYNIDEYNIVYKFYLIIKEL